MWTLKKRSKRILITSTIRKWTSKNPLHLMTFTHNHGTHLQLTCSFGTMTHTFLFVIISASFHWFESLVILILTLLLHIWNQRLKNMVFQISWSLEMTLNLLPRFSRHLVNSMVSNTSRQVHIILKQAVNVQTVCLRTPTEHHLPSPAELLDSREYQSNIPAIMKPNVVYSRTWGC